MDNNGSFNSKSNKQLIKVKTGKIIIKSAFTSGGFFYNNKLVGSNFLNEFLSASINTVLIYDANVIERTQFKEVIGVGFGYKF